MKAPNEKGKSRATSRMAPKAGQGDSGIDLEQAASRTIRVRCPNPACGKVHVVDSRQARRKGRCPCGTLIRIPTVGAAAAPPHAPASPRHKEETRRATAHAGPTQVR